MARPYSKQFDVMSFQEEVAKINAFSTGRDLSSSAVNSDLIDVEGHFYNRTDVNVPDSLGEGDYIDTVGAGFDSPGTQVDDSTRKVFTKGGGGSNAGAYAKIIGEGIDDYMSADAAKGTYKDRAAFAVDDARVQAEDLRQKQEFKHTSNIRSIGLQNVGVGRTQAGSTGDQLQANKARARQAYQKVIDRGNKLASQYDKLADIERKKQGQAIGGTIGAVAGYAIGGPVGGIIGGTLGSLAGGALEDIF